MVVHPVQLRVAPSPIARAQVVVRLVLLAALATVGCSSAYWFLYLLMPATAALLVARDGGEGYLAQDGHRIVRVLNWAAGVYAYLWLLTDEIPTPDRPGSAELTMQVRGRPTVTSALLRLLTTVPGLVVLVALSIVAAVLWVMGALAVLVTGRMPSTIGDFLAMKVTYQFRLVAYHLSLVDTYPSLADLPSGHVPRADAL